jgi:hypothetical protein
MLRGAGNPVGIKLDIALGFPLGAIISGDMQGWIAPVARSKGRMRIVVCKLVSDLLEAVGVKS